MKLVPSLSSKATKVISDKNSLVLQNIDVNELRGDDSAQSDPHIRK